MTRLYGLLTIFAMSAGLFAQTVQPHVVGSGQISQVSGNGSALVTTTTTGKTSGDCAFWDANGNVADAGSACGTGGGTTNALPLVGGTMTGPIILSDGSPATSAQTLPAPGNALTLITRIANADILANQATLFTDGTQSWCAGINYCSNGTYIDDDILTAMYNPSVFSAGGILNLVNKFIANKNGNGEFPIALGTDGTTAYYYSGWDQHQAYATGDGWIMVPQALYLYCQKVGIGSTACTSAYSTNIAAIKTALARDPRNATTHLITVNAGNEYIPGFAFMEYMRFTGDVANANVWYAIVVQKLAALATAAGDTTNASFFNSEYATTVAGIKANLIDGTTGMLIAATGQNSTNLDIVSSVLADYYGLLTTAQNTAIETYINTNYSSLVNSSGYVLESPTGWTTVGYIPSGGGAPYGTSSFSSTQYQGGFWSFHTGWVAYALHKAAATGAPGKVAQLINGYLLPASGDGTTEWFNRGDTTPKGTLNNMVSPQGALWAATNYTTLIQGPNGFICTADGYGGCATTTSTTVAGLFGGSSVTQVSSTFNEGSIGATIIGTKPATDLPNGSWVQTSGTAAARFQSGGGAFGPATSGAANVFINGGARDGTVTFSNVAFTGGTNFDLFVRLDAGYTHGLFLDWNNGALTLTDVGSVNTTVATGNSGAATTGNIVFTLNGTLVSVNVFGTVISGTIPSSSPTMSNTNTYIGFSPDAAIGATNGTKITVGTLTVMSSACVGALITNGSCLPSSQGFTTIAAAATSVAVSAPTVTANSLIVPAFDASLGTKLGVTCNVTSVQPYVSARTPGTGFTLSVGSAPTTNPACFGYQITN